MTEATTTVEKSVRKTLTGTVVSDKMMKTIVVRVERKVRHPLYHRIVKKAKKFKVHDEENSARRGDLVLISETRPLSKDKRWRLLEVLKKGSDAIDEKELG